jgi:hypothetical protein
MRGERKMSKITPTLWYDGTAEEAARFYVTLLPDSGIEAVNRSTIDTPSGPPMHYLDKPRRPSIGTMGWVRIQSATRTKLGQNSTGVDTPAQGLSYSLWRALPRYGT